MFLKLHLRVWHLDPGITVNFKKMLLCGGAAAILMAGSVLASVGYLTELEASRLSQSRSAIREHQALRDSYTNTQRQINTTLAMIDSDMAEGYRTRASRNLEKLTSLRGESDTFLAQLHANTEPIDSRPMLDALRLPADDATITTIIALMFELCPIVAMSVYSRIRVVSKTPPSRGKTAEFPTVKQPGIAGPVAWASVRPDTQTVLNRAADLLRSGEATPTYDGLRKILKCSQEEVALVFQGLREAGVLKREGRRHVLSG